MGKSKIYNLLQPLIPAIAWALVLWVKPEFSIANYAAKLYKLSANEMRPLDIVFFTAVSTYFLRFIDWLFDKTCTYMRKMKSVSLGIEFTNLQNKKETFTIVDPPQGSPKRVRITANVQFHNLFLFKTLISKYFRPILFQIEWQDSWLQVEMEDINNIQGYVEVEQGRLNLDLLKLTHWPKGSMEVVLAIVTMHTNTTSSFLDVNIEVRGSKFKKWLFKRTLTFIKNNHEVVLSSN